jgi:hypothetical protein
MGCETRLGIIGSNPVFFVRPWALQREGRGRIASYVAMSGGSPQEFEGNLQGILQVFVYFHDSSLVAAAIAVVRRWSCQTDSQNRTKDSVYQKKS